MSFQMKFQFKIRQKCRSKLNDIGHTLELGPSKSDPNYSPPKKLKRLEKIDFQHTTITLGLVNK